MTGKKNPLLTVSTEELGNLADPRSLSPEEAVAEIEQLRKKLGELMVVNKRLLRSLNRKERDIHLLASLRDNSERLRRVNEEEKNLQYLYNDLLLKNSPNIIFLFDENLRYVLGSQNFASLADTNKSELLNKPLPQVFSENVEPGWVEKIHRQCQGVLRSHQPLRYNDTIHICTEEPLSVQISIAPIIEEKRPCRGVIITITDVSELLEAQWRAEEAARSKSAFLANMSHEIRTPMNAIVGITEILLHDSELTHQQNKYINDIKISSSSLLTIINDILDLSKLESGKMSLVPANFNFKMMVDNICSMAMCLAADKDVKFRYVPNDALPMYLYGDDVRLRQILLNILSNGIKFTNEGSVTLHIVEEEGRLRFEITDTGIGIRKEELELLFQPFQQLDSTKNRCIRGTGLGLSICKSLVELMGGTISVSSVYGQGSTFTVVIPTIIGDAMAVSETVGDCHIHYAPQARVLIVDDNEVNLRVAFGLLKTLHGIDSEMVTSGKDAIRKIQENDYHLVFMDQMMPEMDGKEAVGYIRALGGKYETLPVVALTANAMIGAKEMLIAAGMSDFLSKPIRKSQLAEILYKWLPEEFRLPEEDKPPSAYLAADGLPQYSPSISKVLDIDEIDVGIGLETVAGQQDVYELSLKLLEERIPRMAELMEDLLEKDDLKELSIHVHGMKSSLASVGAMELSYLALNLEQAANSDDFKYCREMLPSFLRQLGRLGHQLHDLFREPAAEALPLGTDEELRTGLLALRDALAEYDYEAITAAGEQLMTRDFGEERNALLARIKEQVDLFDYDGASGQVKALLEK